MTKDELIAELKIAGATEEQIATCSNNDDREELLKQKKEEYKEQLMAEALANANGERAKTVADVGPSEKFDMNAYMKERLPFKAFKDADKYKDDIVVTINGVKTVIQRGILVTITREVYQAIDIAERQKAVSNAYSLKLQEEYKARVDANMM